MADKPAHLVVGQTSEDLALEYLLGQGLTLVERNFRSRQGEIDLVMLHNQHLVFVEVRYRRNSRYGSAAESVSVHKQRKIRITAELFLQMNPNLGFQGCRFDVLAIDAKQGSRVGENDNSITMDWICDAF